MKKVKKSQLIWQIHILFQLNFGRACSVHFLALMVQKSRYKYYNERIVTLEKGNIQSHNQEESKSAKSAMINQFHTAGLFQYLLKTFGTVYTVACRRFLTYFDQITHWITFSKTNFFKNGYPEMFQKIYGQHRRS